LKSHFVRRAEKAPRIAQIGALQKSIMIMMVTKVKLVVPVPAAIVAIEVDREIVTGRHTSLPPF